MRIHLAATLLAAALSTPAAARAAEARFAYVDLQRAVQDVDEGKAVKSSLQREFAQRQKLLDEKQEELKRLKADFDKQAVVMADEAKREKQGELDRKFIEVQGLFVQLQKELTEKERDAMRGLFDKMGGIIREIAEAGGLTFVLEKNDSGLLYAPASMDLTNELVRKYNSRFKPGAADAKKTDKRSAEVEKKPASDKKPAAEKKK